MVGLAVYNMLRAPALPGLLLKLAQITSIEVNSQLLDVRNLQKL